MSVQEDREHEVRKTSVGRTEWRWRALIEVSVGLLLIAALILGALFVGFSN